MILEPACLACHSNDCRNDGIDMTVLQGCTGRDLTDRLSVGAACDWSWTVWSIRAPSSCKQSRRDQDVGRTSKRCH